MEGPAYRYYGALQGAWSSTFEFELTDRAALGELKLRERFDVRSFALMSGTAGALMSTTLEATDDAAVFRHTTRVTVLGVTLFTTEELIDIAADGQNFVIEGTQKALGAPVQYAGKGHVADDAMGATYHLVFFGQPLQQQTQRTDKGLLLTQETAFSRGRVELERR